MSIWNKLLPHRKIDLSGNGIHVLFNKTKYHGKEMSDGERVILYMICQVLLQRENTLLIIDEPELHIHKSIVDKLWTILENERNDCVFMYITHDINFVISRNDAKIIWVKNFDGSNWEYEFLDKSDYEEFPEELLYEIIGTRKKIVFVEGQKKSYDYRLYQEIYQDKDYHIIPCGGCQEVIRLVRAKRKYKKLSFIEVFGIIDRDFRTEKEITSLEKDDIYCLDVAEVENLFVVPEVLDIMKKALFCQEGTAQKAKDFIKSLYSHNKDKQVSLALEQEMKHQLSLFELDSEIRTPEKIKEKIDEQFSIEKIKEILNEKQTIFNSAKEIDDILRVFNFKVMSQKIGDKFGLTNKTEENYPSRVLKLLELNRPEKEKILQAIKKYTPKLP